MFIGFLLKLLLLQVMLKTIFVIFNYNLISPAFQFPFQLIGWSLFSEFLMICVINLPLLLLIYFLRISQKMVVSITLLMVLVNLLNLVFSILDIVYFHFQRQRANADLLYVIKRPFDQSFGSFPAMSFVMLLSVLVLGWVIYRWTLPFRRITQSEKKYPIAITGIGVMIVLLSLLKPDFILPNASLRSLNTSGNSVAQNSLHSFIFSIYRNSESKLPDVKVAELSKPLSIQPLPIAPDSLKRKNVILFIMESIPAEFFTAGAVHKVQMPFIDSLVTVSTYFDEAYSFGHNSNKGITSILTGLPTLTEIPLYHAAFAGLPKTNLGDALSDQGYSSAFFIGDHYDDFGFAKCCNWVGIQHYFSRESLPGYKELPSNPMGVQDEYVLDFMKETLDTLHQPFLAINYNTSTHYPNEIPESFSRLQPDQNFTPEMRSMAYYSECIRKFIKQAKQMPWYQNSLFIFCSDHWMYPDVRHLNNDVRESFHIPIFIFDPSAPKGSIKSYPVSQFDLLPTILGISGYDKPVISYGASLFSDQHARRPYVFCKENNDLYEIINSSYVFGYNATRNQAEFLYNFRTDPQKKKNLTGNLPLITYYTGLMNSFFKTALDQYRGRLAD